MRHFSFLLIAFVLLRVTLLPAVIKGIVEDHKKKPLSSIQVTIKDTGAATLTHIDGTFSLAVPDPLKTVTLLFERNGYHSFETHIKVDKSLKVFRIFFIPDEYIQEKITVTALNEETASVSIPMAETSMSSMEIQEKISENVMETLSDTAGVHFIGKGGFSITPSIRGLARRRVLVLVDGSRVTSDRRVGSSASFVPPEIARRIEVVRSSASVLYGSDAIGGVMNILTRPTKSPDQPNTELNALNLNFNSINKRINAGITYGTKAGKWHLYTGAQFTRADDYSSPRQRILHSGYNYYSGILDVSLSNEKQDFFLGYVGGYGKDIGKPDRENDPDKYDVVPSESDQIFRLGYNEKTLVKNGTLHLSLFLNPSTYNLSKIDKKNNRREFSDTRVLNLSLKTTLKKKLSDSLSYQLGMEWFSRQNLKIDNRIETGENVDVSFPIRKGQRNDYGMFFTLNYQFTPTLGIDSGLRYTFFSIGADVQGTRKERDCSAASYFLGVTQKLGSAVSLFCNIGRAFRFPSLSESFYTGITGRRFVIGNPDLEPESSFNIDTGMKFSGKKYFIGLYFFSYRVDHLVERYRNEQDIYTYDNIQQGRILGGELEVQYSPFKNMHLFGHYFYYRGRSDIADEPLNDIPAPRVYLGGRVYFNRLWFEGNFLHSFKKSDPGPAEVKNDAYNVLNLKGGYYLSSNLFLYLKVANLLNETYYANPDPDIPEAKGIHFSTGIHFYF